jgi:hypothetical protein
MAPRKLQRLSLSVSTAASTASSPAARLPLRQALPLRLPLSRRVLLAPLPLVRPTLLPLLVSNARWKRETQVRATTDTMNSFRFFCLWIRCACSVYRRRGCEFGSSCGCWSRWTPRYFRIVNVAFCMFNFVIQCDDERMIRAVVRRARRWKSTTAPGAVSELCRCLLRSVAWS